MELEILKRRRRNIVEIIKKLLSNDRLGDDLEHWGSELKDINNKIISYT